jgi:hypothetical protein
LSKKLKDNPKLKPATLNSFRSAVCKFREMNGFDNFSENELIEFKKFFKG